MNTKDWHRSQITRAVECYLQSWVQEVGIDDVPSAVLHHHYRLMAAEKNWPPLSHKMFTSQLKKLGCRAKQFNTRRAGDTHRRVTALQVSRCRFAGAA